MDRTLSALYEHRADAMAAVDDLVALGVARDHISVVSGSEPSEMGGAGATYGTEREQPGFWESLTSLFVPEEDKRVYEEGISRGGATVIAKVDESRIDRAIDVLESHNAVDLDERQRAWGEGAEWEPYRPGAASLGGAAGVGDVPTPSGAAPEAPAVSPAPSAEAAPETETSLSGEEDVMSVAREESQAGKREVRGGRIRIHTHAVAEPVSEEERVTEELHSREEAGEDMEETSRHTEVDVDDDRTTTEQSRG